MTLSSFLCPCLSINTTTNRYVERVPLSEGNEIAGETLFHKKKTHTAVIYIMRVSADGIIYHYSCDG